MRQFNQLQTPSSLQPGPARKASLFFRRSGPFFFALSLLLLAGCYSPKKKVAERMPGLRSQWTTNVIRQAALPETKVDWPTAVTLLRAHNLKLLAARQSITNAQEALRQVYKDLLPTITLRANLTKTLVSIPSTSFSDVTFNVDSFFNVPGIVNMAARDFGARLSLLRARMTYQATEREQIVELYRLLLGFQEQRETMAQLDSEEQLAKSVQQVDVLAGQVLIEELRARRLAAQKQADALQASAGDLFGDLSHRWDFQTNGWPVLPYTQHPLPLQDSNRVAQLQIQLVALELVGAWAQVRGIKLQYWPELTIFITGPPVYQRAAGVETFWSLSQVRASADLFWRLDTRGYIAQQLRQARRDQALQWARLREESLALMDKLLAAQKLTVTLTEQIRQLDQLLPILQQMAPPQDYAGILKSLEQTRSLRDQERKLRRDLAELNTLFWFVDEEQWGDGKAGL
jgi:hypothetical protein